MLIFVLISVVYMRGGWQVWIPAFQFDLVCDNAYQKELTSTIYMVGSACGVLFLTPLADKLGSKMVMLGCLWVQAVIGTCIIWSGNIIVYLILKFLIGVTNMTAALCSYVLMTETFDTAHREVPTIAMQFFWALGIMTMALFGYLIPEWENLQLTITLPINVLSVVYFFIIPESLPWLLSKGKVGKAEQVIKTFVRVNKLPPVSDLQNTLSVFKLQTHKNSMINSLAYYGIMFSTPDLNGDRFLNLFLLGVVEIPAYILCLISNKFIGRRRSIAIFLFICAAANLSVIFIPDQSDNGADLTKLKTALVIIGKFGITGSYSTIYLYASEVFPTVVRNQGVGASSFFENIGSIAAPNMVYANNSLNNLPLGIFGGLTIVGCGLVLLLPETHNRLLPQTIEEVEKGRDDAKQHKPTVTETYKQKDMV
ncbi:unnamed protein product [Candidula unifasciata]|uniref:Major facilitator superfamily (MFS) profile domain-containing protein n=1 Tax=Candidula unifasciata TaxID=100452 RepID=A0A8S4A3S5_9EUPU|nr:unnamed protein product [Candidula unifasciata]